MLLEKYYEIIDRPSHEVSRMWKIYHILFLGVAAITGLAASYSFTITNKQFAYNCILYPTISFKNKYENLTHKELRTINASEEFHLTIDLVNTKWGDDWICAYCEFVPLTSIIVGSILIAYFIMFPRGGSRSSKIASGERSWHLVIPSIVISTVFLIILFTSLFKMSGGLDAFCGEFASIYEQRNQHSSEVCPILMNEFAKEITSGLHGHRVEFKIKPHTNIFIALFLLGTCVMSWIFYLLSLILRVICVADFKIVEVVIQRDDKKPDKLLQKNPTGNADSDSAESETITVEVN